MIGVYRAFTDSNIAARFTNTPSCVHPARHILHSTWS